MMTELVAQNEPIIRLGFVVSVIVPGAVWQWLAPHRALACSRRTPCPSNLGIGALNTMVPGAIDVRVGSTDETARAVV